MKKLVFICLLIPLAAYAGFSDFTWSSFNLGGGGVCKVQKPDLVVDPTEFAFPNQSSGTTRSTNIALSNTGNAALTGITFGTFSSAIFSHSSSATNPCGTTLAAKATCYRKVSFSPAAATAYSDALAVSSNQLDAVTVPVSGTGTATDPYSTYFTNAFGCDDSGTVYTCADPNVFTIETDTGAVGSIVSGEYVITYFDGKTASYVSKTGLTPHSDTSARIKISFSNVSMFLTSVARNMQVLTLSTATSDGYALYIKSNTTSKIVSMYITYKDGAGATQTSADFSFVPENDTDYTVDLRTTGSTDTATADGEYTLLVNNALIGTATGITTYITAPTIVKTGMIYTAQNLTGSISIDDVVLGYK